MLNNIWKPLNNYCLINALYTGQEYDDKIIEITCVKVLDNCVAEIFSSKISPSFSEIAYPDFNFDLKIRAYPPNQYPTMLEIAPKIIEFAKGLYFVGYKTNNTLAHIIREGKLDYFKNVVDVKTGLERDFGEILDFSSDNVANCMEIKKTYDEMKKYYYQKYELPKNKQKCR